MRLVTNHMANPINDKLQIEVVDEPGAGGANHKYRITYPHGFEPVMLEFQNGPINENGINGLTQEVLLAVVIDRLRSFQSGPFACRENALALTHCEDAMHWLHHRTHDRLRRGVEGQTKT